MEVKYAMIKHIDKKPFLKKNIISSIVKSVIKYHDFGNKPLLELIKQRNLYLRVSLTGECNQSCKYCHKEGSMSTSNNADINVIKKIIKTAKIIGYHRIQFTGGEPLLYPNLLDIIEEIEGFKEMEFGITTNGILLFKHIDLLIDSNISRIHISLGNNTLEKEYNSDWYLPFEYIKNIKKLSLHSKEVYLNVPVMIKDICKVQKFIEKYGSLDCNIRFFEIIHKSQNSNNHYYIRKLHKLRERVINTNYQNIRKSINTNVTYRGYLISSGFRCQTCQEFSSCKEASRSLRLSFDGILKPCLACRTWDISLNDFHNYIKAFTWATFLALDY